MICWDVVWDDPVGPEVDLHSGRRIGCRWDVYLGRPVDPDGTSYEMSYRISRAHWENEEYVLFWLFSPLSIGRKR